MLDIKKGDRIIVNIYGIDKEVWYIGTGINGIVCYGTEYGYGTTEENHRVRRA